MKKSLVKLMSSLMILTVPLAAVGCSKPATTDTTTTVGEKTKLSIWHIQTTAPFPDIIKDSMDRFKVANPNYDVEITPMQNDAFKTKLKIAMSSNTMPDIFPTWSGGPMNEFIDANKISDLTTYMDRDSYKAKFMHAAISQVTYKDKLWGVPVENVAVATFFYNKDIFAKYNLQVPKTTKELEAICDILKTNKITPFSLANKTKWTGSMYYMYLVDRIGGKDAFAKAVDRTGTFEDTAFTQAGTIIQDWVKKDYFNEGFNGLDEDSGQSRTLLYTGKAAMTLMGSWFVSTAAGENKDFMSKVGSFSFPTVEGGKGDANTVIGTVGDNFYSVASSCKDVEGAFKAITYLIDDTAVEKRITDGRIPPIKGVKVSDSNLQQVLTAVEKAPSVQLWYDQYLPPEISELHKDTSQALFGLTKTPEQVNKDMEAAALKYYKK